MANSDKNIVITPNISSTTADPKIVFSGADASTGAQNITLQAYPTNSGTLSFEGSAGQLFSISNTMTGTIYSVNDVSGVPSIEVLDTGLVKIAQYSGNLLVGTGVDNGIAKVQITGDQTVSGKTIYGPNATWGAYLQVGGSSREYVDNGTYASVATSDGNLHLDAASGKTLYLNYYDGSDIRFGNGANSYVGNIDTSGNLYINGQFTVGNGANASYINMFDSDNGRRVIHCNSDRIGFLNSSEGWGAYCDDSGNWYANNLSGTNTGDQTSVSGNAGTVTHSPSRTDGTAYNIAWVSGQPSQLYSCDAVKIRSDSGTISTNSIHKGDFTQGSMMYGASYTTQTSTVTGACKIRLPVNTKGLYPMLRFTVKIYNYSTYTSREYSIGGHFSSSQWYNQFAYCTSDQSAPQLNVRWGYEGTYLCVWIGETSTSWSYPQVYVTDFQQGYSAIQADWYVGAWNISFVTSFDSVTNGPYTAATTANQYTLSGGSFNFTGASYAQAPYLGVTNTSSSTGYGLSLYNGGVAGQPTYGIMFAGTSTFGTHGSTTGDWATYFTMNSDANRGWIFRNISSGNMASINNSGTAVFNGNVTAYSDIRVKKNILTIDNALNKVMQLRGVTYDRTDDVNLPRQTGVIAQEVLKVLPEAVGGSEETTYNVAYGNMVGLLIEAIKEQQKQIEELTSIVKSLKE